MATAAETRRSAAKTATPKIAPAKAVRGPAKAKTISFVVAEDNGGNYRWTLINGTGVRLGQSEPFATAAAAHTAATLVQGAAAAAEIVSQ